jgi:hypothetical protein
MTEPLTAKTLPDEMASRSWPRPAGCLKGCLLVFVGVLLIYAVSVGVALITLTSNYNKWTAQNIQSYSAMVKYGTCCNFYNIGQEVVQGGSLISSNAGYSQPAIDRLFQQVPECAIFLICQVEYDSKYGYPTRIDEFDLDMGDVTTITALTPES